MTRKIDLIAAHDDVETFKKTTKDISNNKNTTYTEKIQKHQFITLNQPKSEKLESSVCKIIQRLLPLARFPGQHPTKFLDLNGARSASLDESDSAEICVGQAATGSARSAKHRVGQKQGNLWECDEDNQADNHGQPKRQHTNENLPDWHLWRDRFHNENVQANRW